MVTSSTSPRPGTLFGVAVTVVLAGAGLGALTNAINGLVSPTYFRTIMGWQDVENIRRAAIAQGIFEGLIYGVLFSFVFTLVVGIVSKARATFGFALKHMLIAGGIALAAWCMGGVLAMGLATLSPEFYRNAFRGVPTDFGEMLKYAWVGGSIWGVMFGAVLSLTIASITVMVDWLWQRRVRQ
jgi:hypothetical protein